MPHKDTLWCCLVMSWDSGVDSEEGGGVEERGLKGEQ